LGITLVNINLIVFYILIVAGLLVLTIFLQRRKETELRRIPAVDACLEALGGSGMPCAGYDAS
jgi:hypothetical protein